MLLALYFLLLLAFITDKWGKILVIGTNQASIRSPTTNAGCIWSRVFGTLGTRNVLPRFRCHSADSSVVPLPKSLTDRIGPLSGKSFEDRNNWINSAKDTVLFDEKKPSENSVQQGPNLPFPINDLSNGIVMTNEQKQRVPVICGGRVNKYWMNACYQLIPKSPGEEESRYY